jgi:hypothetical protein
VGRGFKSRTVRNFFQLNSRYLSYDRPHHVCSRQIAPRRGYRTSTSSSSGQIPTIGGARMYGLAGEYDTALAPALLLRAVHTATLAQIGEYRG